MYMKRFQCHSTQKSFMGGGGGISIIATSKAAGSKMKPYSSDKKYYSSQAALKTFQFISLYVEVQNVELNPY